VSAKSHTPSPAGAPEDEWAKFTHWKGLHAACEVRRRFDDIPYEDPERRREYVRAYMRTYKSWQRRPGKHCLETSVSKVAPQHVRRLAHTRGRVVAAPEVLKRLLHLLGDCAIVAIDNTAIESPWEQAGLQ